MLQNLASVQPINYHSLLHLFEVYYYVALGSWNDTNFRPNYRISQHTLCIHMFCCGYCDMWYCFNLGILFDFSFSDILYLWYISPALHDNIMPIFYFFPVVLQKCTNWLYYDFNYFSLSDPPFLSPNYCCIYFYVLGLVRPFLRVVDNFCV